MPGRFSTFSGYDAKPISTYVPLPFQTMMQMGDVAEKRIEAANTALQGYQSDLLKRSAIANSEDEKYLKSKEAEAKTIIDNVDPNKLLDPIYTSQLKNQLRNISIDPKLDDYQKSYEMASLYQKAAAEDPLADPNRIKNFTGYSTDKDGIFQDLYNKRQAIEPYINEVSMHIPDEQQHWKDPVTGSWMTGLKESDVERLAVESSKGRINDAVVNQEWKDFQQDHPHAKITKTQFAYDFFKNNLGKLKGAKPDDRLNVIDAARAKAAGDEKAKSGLSPIVNDVYARLLTTGSTQIPAAAIATLTNGVLTSDKSAVKTTMSKEDPIDYAQIGDGTLKNKLEFNQKVQEYNNLVKPLETYDSNIADHKAQIEANNKTIKFFEPKEFTDLDAKSKIDGARAQNKQIEHDIELIKQQRSKKFEEIKSTSAYQQLQQETKAKGWDVQSTEQRSKNAISEKDNLKMGLVLDKLNNVPIVFHPNMSGDNIRNVDNNTYAEGWGIMSGEDVVDKLGLKSADVGNPNHWFTGIVGDAFDDDMVGGVKLSTIIQPYTPTDAAAEGLDPNKTYYRIPIKKKIDLSNPITATNYNRDYARIGDAEAYANRDLYNAQAANYQVLSSKPKEINAIQDAVIKSKNSNKQGILDLLNHVRDLGKDLNINSNQADIDNYNMSLDGLKNILTMPESEQKKIIDELGKK